VLVKLINANISEIGCISKISYVSEIADNRISNANNPQLKVVIEVKKLR
jgi:hypothetical protein